MLDRAICSPLLPLVVTALSLLVFPAWMDSNVVLEPQQVVDAQQWLRNIAVSFPSPPVDPFNGLTPCNDYLERPGACGCRN